jgi:hypothetical protein
MQEYRIALSRYVAKKFQRVSIAAAVTVLAGASMIAGSHAWAVDLNVVAHVAVDMWEQDVFVDGGEKGKGGVFRIGPAEYSQMLDLPVFATTQTVHHDPRNPDAAGPFPKGEDLGMTLGEWLAASGAVSYDCDNGIGRMSATFENLVPRGVYTVWNFFVPTPSAEPFSTYDLPLGDRAGRENFFAADRNGNAQYSIDLAGCLQGSGSQLAAGLAIAWHSDGATYGPNPGGLGRASHIQLFLLLPSDEDLNG